MISIFASVQTNVSKSDNQALLLDFSCWNCFPPAYDISAHNHVYTNCNSNMKSLKNEH